MEKPAEFYSKLNQSTVSYSEQWSNYRKKITGFIMSNFTEGGRTLILGAGNMNDMEFNDINRASSEVTLADIDIKTLDKWKEKDVKTEFIDFGCLGNIADATSYSEAVEMIKSGKPYVKSNLGKNKYDNVLVSPFYTQLVLPWLMTVFPDMKTDPIGLEAGLALASKTIRITNEYIRKLATPKSIVCFWTDMLEYENDDPVFLDISKNIGDIEWMTAFMQQYIENYGHGLGSYGQTEMETHLRNQVSSWLVWPFNSSISMVVKITSGMLKE